MGLTITRNVTIVGTNQATTIINSASPNSIFTVNSGLNVTIANLTFANGTTTAGGAIFNAAALNITNCTFNTNTATGEGGAIYNSGNLNMAGCTFINNTSEYSGGAICNIGTLNITNSIIRGNSVQSTSVGGGAIFDSGTLNVNFSSFVNNSATSGSTIYYSSGTVNAENNWWGSNNNPSTQVYGTFDYSNWLYMTLTVNPTTIANGSTGAVTVSFNNIYNGTNVTSINPSNGCIVNGTVVSFSSVLGSFNPVTTVTSNGIATTTFTANNTQIRTINASTDNQTVSTYINGIGTKISAGNVTCINASSTNLTSTLTSLNSTALSGRTVIFNVNGSIYNVTSDANGVANLSYTPTNAGVYSVITSFAGDSTYGDCSNTSYLTVQTNDVYLSPTGSDTTGDGTASNPFATIQTGINCVVNGGTIYLASGTYIGTGNGGLTFTQNVTIVGANQATTIINAANSNNIFTVNSGFTVMISNLTLTNAIATNGSVIYNNGNVTAINCIFTNNKATTQGGAIYDYNSNLTLTGCNFTNNTANLSFGGAIYNYSSNLTLNGCNFTNNTANYWGGAICNAYGSTLNMSNCTFSTNIATNQGGAIANVGVNAILNGSKCTFIDNNAVNNGGAIYNNGITTVNFNSFVNNTATTGSAIYLSMGTVNAENNWWGSNNNPSSQINGTVDYSNWLYMTETVNPTVIVNGSTANVTVSFNNIWNGTNVVSINPANGNIPDGTVVNFRSILGTFNPTTTITTNGIATTIFTTTTLNSDFVNATTNNQTVSAPITVYIPAPVANFTANTTNGTTPLNIQFNDLQVTVNKLVMELR